MFEEKVDALIQPAIDLAKQFPNDFSITLLQRKLRIGYVVAAMTMDKLEERRIVGPLDEKTRRRPVLK